MADPVFLTLAEIIEVHVDQIRRYGGQSGVQDLALLQSALAQPQASFAGRWLHRDLYAMAAAYAYNPFVDGNKRTALASALVFLELNGISLIDPRGRLKDAMFRMASGELGNDEFARLIKNLPRQR